jgi:hypothetical protein
MDPEFFPMVLWGDRGEDTFYRLIKNNYSLNSSLRPRAENYLYQEIYNLWVLALFI